MRIIIEGNTDTSSKTIYPDSDSRLDSSSQFDYSRYYYFEDRTLRRCKKCRMFKNGKCVKKKDKFKCNRLYKLK